MIRKNFELISVITGSIIAICLAFICYSKPAYNWDTLPYVALILNLETNDLKEVHKRTYDIAQREVPPERYKWMIDTTHTLRKELLTDHKKFFQFTSFFRVKPIYIVLSYFSHKAGAPLTKAPVLVSVVSFVLIFWILFFWLTKSFSGVMPVIISLCIVTSPPILEAARLATPDILSATIILVTCYLMLAGSNWLWVALMITLSILVRLDNLLFALILFPIYFFYQRNNTFNMKALIFLLLAILIWVSIAVIVLRLSNFNNGFQSFYGNLFNRINPLNMVGFVLNGFKTIQTSHLILILLICYLSLFYKKQMSIQLFTRKQSLFIGMLIYVVVKFLFFPDFTTRLHLPVYIISIVFIIEEIGDRSTYLYKNYRT